MLGVASRTAVTSCSDGLRFQPYYILCCKKHALHKLPHKTLLLHFSWYWQSISETDDFSNSISCWRQCKTLPVLCLLTVDLLFHTDVQIVLSHSRFLPALQSSLQKFFAAESESQSLHRASYEIKLLATIVRMQHSTCSKVIKLVFICLCTPFAEIYSFVRMGNMHAYEYH